MGSAIATPFDVVEAGCLPITTSVQHTELHTLTWACTLAKEKSAIVCTDSRYAFRLAHYFRMLCKQHGFLTSRGNKIKNGHNVLKLLDEILLPAALAVIKSVGLSKPVSLEAQGNHFADISARNAALKGTNSIL